MSASQTTKGTLPTQAIPNVQGQHFVEDSNGLDAQVEHLKAVTVLRSGKIIDKTIPPKPSNPDMSTSKAPPTSQEVEESKHYDSRKDSL